MFISRTALIATLMLGAAACGRSDNANDQVPADATADAAATQADASNPFADAEQKMSQAMMAAVGPTAGDTWVRMMIAHHQGAIDMSQAALRQGLSGDVEKMARDTVAKQQKEIGDLKKLVQQGNPDPKTMALYHQAMTEMEQAMKNAKGGDLSETYMRKMLAHHEGGAKLADIALDNGVTGALRAQVEKTHNGQHEEAEMVEAMLSGKPMQHAKTGSATKTMPVPGTKTTEHVAHDMNEMGNMDMNQMNHM